MSADHEPWFAAATHLLDVRRQDRLLAVGIGIAGARSLAALVGKTGTLVAAMTDGDVAQQLATLALPQCSVLVSPQLPDTRLGTFDAVLLAPRVGPVPPLGAIADLLRSNLRPGGRFVVDVPGAAMVPDLLAAGETLGWPPERLQRLRGVADDALADSLRGAGLRSVTGVLGTHLLHANSPGDCVDAFAPDLDLLPPEANELTDALVRRHGGHGPIDVLVHRTRLQGLR